MKKIKKAVVLLIALALILGMCACGSKTDGGPTISAGEGGSDGITVEREAAPPALETANGAAAIAVQQYIYARLMTEAFITADFASMQRDEIETMVNDLAGLWITASQLTSGSVSITDQALLVLGDSGSADTAAAAGAYSFAQLAARAPAYQTVQLADSDAQEWAESFTAKYDAIKGGHTIKQLAQQLGTDAKSAYEQLVLAQEIIKSGADADAEFYDKLTKIAQATKTGCKVGLFVTATIASGGGTLSALAGSSVTLAQGGAVIVGGVDCIADVAATGSTLILGENHQVTVGMNDIKDKLAPVSAIVGLATFNPAETGEQLSYIGDSLTDLFFEGKILGVKVFGESGGTQIKAQQTDTSKASESDAAGKIEDMGFTPPENREVTAESIFETFKITAKDALDALDELKAQALEIAKAAGVLIHPTMDEVAGSYGNASVTYTEVYISESMKAASADTDDSEEESELSCDLDIMAMIEAMEGQSQAMTLNIEKTDGGGTMKMIPKDEDDSDISETPPIPFVYSEGVLSFDYISEGAVMTGSLDAVAGVDGDITLSGTLRITGEGYEEDFYVDLYVQGSKLPVV